MLPRITTFLPKNSIVNGLLFLLVVVTVLVITRYIFNRYNKSPISVPVNAHPNDLILTRCSYKTKTKVYSSECGTLVVLENRSNPSSRMIALPVKRIHAVSTSPHEPRFYLTGGPGISNMNFKPPDDLLINHDVVMVGYRGVDGSSILDCPEFSKAVLGDGSNVLSSESLAIMTNAILEWRKRMEVAGVDLAGYTIQQVAEDIEAARIQLGYGQINSLSESYGTRVAQVYAGSHSKVINRSMMMGVNPPGRFVWEPEMVDKQIEYYSQLWAKDESTRNRTRDLAATIRNVSHHMPRHWLFFPIDPGKVNTMAFVMLFNRNTSAMVFDAYVAAERGDASGLTLLSMAYAIMVPKSFVWGDFFAKGASADLNTKYDYITSLRAPDSIIGSPISLMIWGPLSQAWMKNTPGSEINEVHSSKIETLLVSGSVDFSTPAQYATSELLPSLKTGKQVVLSEIGHVGDMWGIQPEATRRLLTSFYDTGRVDDSLYKYQPMNFKVSFGFPAIAKVLFGTSTLLVIGLVLGLNRIIRNAHQRGEKSTTQIRSR